MAKRLNWEKANKTRGGCAVARQAYSEKALTDTQFADLVRDGKRVFIFSREPDKKVHLATFSGTVCKLERLGLAIFKLRLRALEMPPSRSLCRFCETNTPIKDLPHSNK
jgi:hypothetical protein